MRAEKVSPHAQGDGSQELSEEYMECLLLFKSYDGDLQETPRIILLSKKKEKRRQRKKIPTFTASHYPKLLIQTSRQDRNIEPAHFWAHLYQEGHCSIKTGLSPSPQHCTVRSGLSLFHFFSDLYKKILF